MKKFKLIFGLLMVAAFVATAVISSTTNDENLAIRKDVIRPR